MVRDEIPADVGAIRAIDRAAFGTSVEADLVDALRASGNLLISLVAIEDGEPIGHIAFSPVALRRLEDGPAHYRPTKLAGAGMGPLAVRPESQRRGHGGRLIHAGLARCRALGVDYAVVLGEPDYYSRFGFRSASRLGLGNDYGVDDEFMALELRTGCLRGVGGVVSYSDEFG